MNILKNKEKPVEQEEQEEQEELAIIPIPALVTVLLNAENEKGTPLTEDEVLDLRDNMACMAMPISEIENLNESRGYSDIDPEHVWEEWTVARIELS
ncbi:MAG: hypothetical protein HRU38_25220 [Saccharospirillaceae bacterium]|nr:hypothetical protein [Saccharospirillaceae bacterium]